MQNGVRGELRRNEYGEPVFVIVNQIKIYCHKEIEEQTEDGDIVHVKMRPTQPFLDAFNTQVADLLDEAIRNTRERGSTNMTIEDVPGYEPGEGEDEHMADQEAED
jgi:hypothetical protein